MIGSSVEEPSNSAKIESYGRPRLWASTFSRPRWAIPITTSRAPRVADELDQLVEHRDRHVEALDRELLLPEVRLVHEPLERVDLGQPAEQRLLLLGRERRRNLPDSIASRSHSRWRCEAMCSIS